MFPRMEGLVGQKMDTPTLVAQHDDLLHRIAAVRAILSAAPSTDEQRTQCVQDLRTEFDGWCTVLLTHLRDEEAKTFPLFLLVGKKY